MILKTGVLQKSSRNMRVLIGDILTYSFSDRVETVADWIELTAAVVRSSGWSRLNDKKFRQSLGTCTIYCWVFQNMDIHLAENLAKALSRRRAFLGAIQVDFSKPLHLVFFRNSLIEKYRLFNGIWTEFFDMGENEDPDLAVKEIVTESGFRMDYEDLGARRTIFDNYDSLDHFRRIADFARVVSKLPGGSEELASEVPWLWRSCIHVFLTHWLHARGLMSERKRQKTWRRWRYPGGGLWRQSLMHCFRLEMSRTKDAWSVRRTTKIDYGRILRLRWRAPESSTKIASAR
jgi:hypothetical protein